AQFDKVGAIPRGRMEREEVTYLVLTMPRVLHGRRERQVNLFEPIIIASHAPPILPEPAKVDTVEDDGFVVIILSANGRCTTRRIERPVGAVAGHGKDRCRGMSI